MWKLVTQVMESGHPQGLLTEVGPWGKAVHWTQQETAAAGDAGEGSGGCSLKSPSSHPLIFQQRLPGDSWAGS